MLDVKSNIKNMISSIYECQKKIMINRRFIRELESDGKGNHTSRLNDEIKDLQGKIMRLQQELRVRFNYSF